MSQPVRIHRIETCSLVNGPGKRFVVWFRGCPFHCPGCFNEAARSQEGGELIEVDELVLRIKEAEVEGVTFSGGEPFLQAKEGALILRKCASLGLNSMVYTGFTFSELKGEPVPGARELLRECDLILDGPYKKAIPPTGEWTGSGNQRVIALSRKGMEMKGLRRTKLVEQEYIIDRVGVVFKTGI
jgi:anaerobic ribonucleoside-triphosphate reductase activating protein